MPHHQGIDLFHEDTLVESVQDFTYVVSNHIDDNNVRILLCDISPLGPQYNNNSNNNNNYYYYYYYYYTVSMCVRAYVRVCV